LGQITVTYLITIFLDNNRGLRIENANHNRISKNNLSNTCGILIDGEANLILNNNISVSFYGGGYGGISLFGSCNEIIGNFFFSGSVPGEGVAWKCSASYNVKITHSRTVEWLHLMASRRPLKIIPLTVNH